VEKISGPFKTDKAFLSAWADLEYLDGNFVESILLAEKALEPTEKRTLDPRADYSLIVCTNLRLAEAALDVSPPQLTAALKSLQKTMSILEQTDSKNTRQCLYLFSRLEYLRGNLQVCVDIGLQVIEMNRHYEGAYEYVARALVDLGNLDGAICVMKKAAAYELAWDARHAEKVRARLGDFLVMQASSSSQRDADAR